MAITVPIADDEIRADIFGAPVANAINGLQSYPTPWVAIPLAAGWANYGSAFAPAGCRLDANGVIRLRGLVTKPASAPAVAEVMGTLPVGYRPPYQMILAVASAYGAAATTAQRVDVQTSGSLVIMFSGQTGQFVSFDTLTFGAT